MDAEETCRFDADADAEQTYLQIVRRSGRALKNVPERFRTKAVCEAAVAKSGRALRWVPEALKTPELCAKAVRRTASAIRYVPSEAANKPCTGAPCPDAAADHAARPVRWNGVVFFRPAEARWAVFLDSFGIAWEYRRRHASLPSGMFPPSFWLPEWQVWLDVRRDADEKAKTLAWELCRTTGFAALLPDGPPSAAWQGTVFYLGADAAGMDAAGLAALMKDGALLSEDLPPVAVMEDKFLFSCGVSEEAEPALWLFAGRWKTSFVFRPAGSGEEAEFEDPAGNRRLCLYQRGYPFVFLDAGDEREAEACRPENAAAAVGSRASQACMHLFAPDMPEGCGAAQRGLAGIYALMTGARPMSVRATAGDGKPWTQTRGRCMVCGGLDTLLLDMGSSSAGAVQWICTACGLKGGMLDYCTVQCRMTQEEALRFLVGSWPAKTQDMLAYVRSAFPHRFANGEDFLSEPPEGFSGDVACRRCGCRHFFFKRQSGDVYAYCLACGWLYGKLPKICTSSRGNRAAAWAHDVSRRYGGRCALCGSAENPEAHHIVPWQTDASLRFSIANGILLCRKHHVEAHRAFFSGSGAASAAPDVSMSAVRIKPADWPPALQSLLSRMPKGRLCWTYAELWQDICGTPDPRRREMLRQFIGMLERPAGTHAFWPCLLPEAEADMKLQGSLFRSALQELGAKAVAVLGRRACRVMGLSGEDSRPLVWHAWHGVPVLILPEPADIIGRPDRLELAARWLGAMLQWLLPDRHDRS